MKWNICDYKFPTWATYALCFGIAFICSVVFFAVDIRYGQLHFDTYQYSASVGPQARGLRPILLGLGTVSAFENGSEVSLPGIFWVKRLLFMVAPYSLINDQIFCLVCLIGCACCAAFLLLRKGWNSLCVLSIFSMILLDRTFLTNVSGTRPEALSILLIFLGLILSQSNHWIKWLLSGICFGFAGTMHMYAILFAPLLSVACCLHDNCLPSSFPVRKASSIVIGVILSWMCLVLFWFFHKDAWHLFSHNFEIQRSFHKDPWRFFGYINSFRLGVGWLILLLLILFSFLACRSAFARSRGILPLLSLPVTLGCLFIIPSAFLILKTEQYFYGVFLWVSVLVGFPIARNTSVFWRNFITTICIMIAACSILRIAARVKLGISLSGSKSMHELRKEWLTARVSGAPRLYYFTYEWDIAHHVGVNDVRFYTFPLPTSPDIVREYERKMHSNVPDHSFLVFQRDHADNCPYANKGAFDPKFHSEWQLVETKVWHYDLSPSKPPASIWELWIKKRNNVN